MKKNQLNNGESSRVMYVENKDGDIDGVSARIGWVTFSKSGKSVYYRGRQLKCSKGQGVKGNFFDIDTNEEYWVSGIKKDGSNSHYAEPVQVLIDPDASDEYKRLKDGSE